MGDDACMVSRGKQEHRKAKHESQTLATDDLQKCLLKSPQRLIHRYETTTAISWSFFSF